MKIHKPLLKQIMLFITVGTISTSVNFATFFVCWNVFHLNYKVAATIAYWLSVVAHFFGNRTFTFSGHNQLMRKQLPRYGVLLAIDYSITMTAMMIAVEALHLNPYFGLIGSVGITSCTGFLLAKTWVFKPQSI